MFYVSFAPTHTAGSGKGQERKRHAVSSVESACSRAEKKGVALLCFDELAHTTRLRNAMGNTILSEDQKNDRVGRQYHFETAITATL